MQTTFMNAFRGLQRGVGPEVESAWLFKISHNAKNQRRAILLREWQGLTYREISAELGLTQAAVETLIFRARRALAQGLEQNADTWKRRLRRGADVGGAIAL